MLAAGRGATKDCARAKAWKHPCVSVSPTCVAHQAQGSDICWCGWRVIVSCVPASEEGQQPTECVADRGCCPADGWVFEPLSCQLLQCCRRHLRKLLEQLGFTLEQLLAGAGLAKAQVDDEADCGADVVCLLLEQRQVGRQALLLARQVSQDLLHAGKGDVGSSGQRKHGQHLCGLLLSCHAVLLQL